MANVPGRETSDYGWIIDIDHLYEPGSPCPNEAGVRRPWNTPDDIAAELASPHKGRRFQMYDDDGELYYSGRIITRDEPGSEDDFAPLDNFGKPNAGCTEIWYQNDNGEWVEL